MISIKDLEILATDDELLDMLIYAKCMQAADPRACGVPHSSYVRSELHTVLQRLQQVRKVLLESAVKQCG